MTGNQFGDSVVAEAIQLHREVGPGLLESAYEVLLATQLRLKGLHVDRQVPIAIEHGIRFEDGFRADLVVEKKVILELKCVERINNAHKKQVLTYLRLSGLKLGYVLNFSGELMSTGNVRVVNGLSDSR